MRTQVILSSKKNDCCCVTGSYCLVPLYLGLPTLTAKGGKKANENSWQENTVDNLSCIGLQKGDNKIGGTNSLEKNCLQ